MLLAIDVGNTQTVLGLLDGRKVVEHWRLASDAQRTADELAVIVHTLLGPATAAAAPVDGIAVCSTVPAVLREIRELCRRYYPDVPALVIEPEMDVGIPVRTDNPAEVGADRVINALAAVATAGGPAIVVDFGTATTFDAISAAGEYLGGAIAPGIQISVDALAARGAQLRRVEILAPPSVIGTNTVDALRSGTVFGYAAQVDGMVTRMSAELLARQDGGRREVAVLATGGLAPVVLGVATSLTSHEPWLTLVGLRLAFDRRLTPGG